MITRSYLNYRKALKDGYREAKAVKKSLSLEKLASAMDSHGSFLSSVFNEKAHLNSDQLQCLCQELGWPESDWLYLDLLLQWERSTNSARRKYLKKQIEALRKKKPQAREELKNIEPVMPDSEKLDRYYSNPWCKVVHIFLGIDDYAKTPAQILEHLPLAEQELFNTLKTLEELHMIARNPKGGYQVLRRFLHLPKEAMICRPHQVLMRNISQIKYQSSPPENLETLSVTFSADEVAYNEIHKKFLDFMNFAREKVEDVEHPDSVYQMNFDLFPWTS